MEAERGHINVGKNKMVNSKITGRPVHLEMGIDLRKLNYKSLLISSAQHCEDDQALIVFISFLV